MKKVVLVLSLLFCSCSFNTPLDKLSLAYPDMYALKINENYFAMYDKNHEYKYLVWINDDGYPQVMAYAGDTIDTTKKSYNLFIDRVEYCLSPRTLK